jgi:hypothetical protein
MITKHESRRLSPNATGPNVPAENLRITVFGLPAQDEEIADVRQNVRVRGKPYKEDFPETHFRLFLEWDRANTYTSDMCANGISRRIAAHSDQGSNFKSKILIRTPRLHTPRQELF